MGKRGFARYEFKMNFGRIFHKAPGRMDPLCGAIGIEGNNIDSFQKHNC